MNEPVPYYDDEIDLREVACTLWDGRWLILTMTIIAALTAFAISKWVLPEKFQVTAYITVRAPIAEFKTTQGLTVAPILPDIESLADFIAAPGLLANVANDPTLSTGGSELLSVEDMQEMVEVKVSGKDQLRLQVMDTNPQRAAQLANLWASQATDWINRTYGIAAVVQSLKTQTSRAKEVYMQTQTALEDELSNSQVDALDIRLKNEKRDLDCILAEESALSRVTNDLQALQERLEALPNEKVLSLGDALALTTLQQRALASQICASGTQNVQIQFSSTDMTALTVSSALESIRQIQAALQSKRISLDSQKMRLEETIPDMESELESAQNRINRLQDERNNAWSVYEALRLQQKQLTALEDKSNWLASTSIQAIPPKKKSSPMVLMNTVLGAILGGMLGILWVFVTRWWSKSS